MKTPNKRGADNGAIALSLHFCRLGRAGGRSRPGDKQGAPGFASNGTVNLDLLGLWVQSGWTSDHISMHPRNTVAVDDASIE